MGRILQIKKSKLPLKVVYSIAKLPLYISLVSLPLHVNYTRVRCTLILLLFLSVYSPHPRSGHVTQVGQSIPSLWILSWSEGGYVTNTVTRVLWRLMGVTLLFMGSWVTWRKPCQGIQQFVIKWNYHLSYIPGTVPVTSNIFSYSIFLTILRWILSPHM